jgi:hypothetical protein
MSWINIISEDNQFKYMVYGYNITVMISNNEWGAKDEITFNLIFESIQESIISCYKKLKRYLKTKVMKTHISQSKRQ